MCWVYVFHNMLLIAIAIIVYLRTDVLPSSLFRLSLPFFHRSHLFLVASSCSFFDWIICYKTVDPKRNSVLQKLIHRWVVIVPPLCSLLAKEFFQRILAESLRKKKARLISIVSFQQKISLNSCIIH